MFNKYTLTFQSRTLETEYRESQTMVVKKQYTAFAVQACLYLIFYSVYYFHDHPYFIAVILSCGFVIIFIVFSKFIVDKYPSAINIILPILQIILATIHNVVILLPIQTEQATYNWFNGFSACYFHIALFIQGYILLSQTLIVIGMLLFYVLCVMSPTHVYASLLVSFLSIIVGMVAIKYSIESNKRQQFLHSRESKKWFTIMDTILEQSIIVIKLDKQQDQLRIHQMNNITRRMLQITNDNDLRTILRNLFYIKDSKLLAKENKCSMENHIRTMLQTKQLSAAGALFRQRGSTEKFINTLICQSQLLENKFKVQIVNYWTDEQQMVIMATENLDDFTQNQNKQELNVKNRLITSLAQHCLQVYFKEKNNRFSQLQCMNYFASLNIFLNPAQLLRTQQLSYTQHSIIQILQSVFGSSVKLINQLQVETIKIDLNSLLLVILSIFQFRSSDKALIKIASKTNEENLSEIKFTLKLQTIAISQNMKLYFSRSLFFFDDHEVNTNSEKLKENLLILDKKLMCSQPLKAVTLTLLKYILWKYGYTTTVNIKQKNQLTYFIFSFINQN